METASMSAAKTAIGIQGLRKGNEWEEASEARAPMDRTPNAVWKISPIPLTPLNQPQAK